MKKLIVLGSSFFAYFASFAGMLSAGDATLTLDDNAGSSSFVVQDVDKTNQFKVNSDGQGYFAGEGWDWDDKSWGKIGNTKF